MIDYIAIRLGIRGILLAIPGFPAQRAWENREFTPTSVDDDWFRETFLPGQERKVASDEIQAVGIYQADLFVPIGSGVSDVEALAFQIQSAFKPDKKVTDHAAVYRTERLGGTPDDKWYKLSIRLTWHAFAFSDLGCGTAPVPTGNILDEIGGVILDEVGDAVLEDA